jgi:hypothetical protein
VTQKVTAADFYLYQEQKMFDVNLYKNLSMYDFAMDVYQKAMHMKHDQGVEHYDVQEVIHHLQFILDTDNA